MERLEIEDSDYIVRRIYPPYVKQDGESLSSNGFSDRNEEPSCRLEKIVDLEALRKNHPEAAGWARVRVSEIREMGLEALHDPDPDDPSHCVIRGTEQAKVNRTTRRKLARAAEFIPI